MISSSSERERGGQRRFQEEGDICIRGKEALKRKLKWGRRRWRVGEKRGDGDRKVNSAEVGKGRTCKAA